MYKLYWAPATAALAPQAVLEEAGVAYEIERIDLDRQEQRRPAYLALNPGGYVPTLVTGDGQVLTESAAITLSLCERHPETGLLPGMLMRNAGLKFVCRDVHLRVDTADTVFTRGYREGQVIRIPIAHHEGNYFADEDTLERLFGNGQVAFRYCHPSGEVAADANPNGSRRNIAGILDDKRTVLGLMPHPDRLADAALGGIDGRAMFDGLVEALAA